MMPQSSHVDWFASVVSTPAAARIAVSSRLADYFEKLGRLLDAPGVPLAVLVSGSLGRREPAVMQDPDGAWHLLSDVDLVLVTDGDVPPADRAARLCDDLNAACPEILTTQFTVRAERLTQVRSLFGADLYAAATSPVFVSAGFSLPDMQLPHIGRRERFENLVHQLGNRYFDTSTHLGGTTMRPSSARIYSGLKLSLECLRLLQDTDRGPLRYGDLVRHPSLEVLRAASAERCRALVERREVFDGEHVGVSADGSLLVESLAHFLSPVPVAPLTLDGQAVAGLLSKAFEGRNHVIDVYQLTICLLAVYDGLPPDGKQAVADVLARSWCGLQRDSLNKSVDAMDGLATSSTSSLFDGCGLTEPALAMLRLMREDYYGHLGPRNFGASAEFAYSEI